MLRKHLVFALLAATIPFAAACDDSVAVEDELAGDASDNVAGKADVSDETFTFFTIRRDFRRCISPLCGGYWVARSNSSRTTCANGTRAAECYVATLDTSGLGLSDRDLEAMWSAAGGTSALLLRGDIRPDRYPNFGNLGKFAATEAWLAGAAAGSPSGVGVKAEQTGIRCFAAPCADKLEAKLNAYDTAMIADLDFAPSGATQDEIDVAMTALVGEGDGLIVFGDRYTVRSGRRTAKGRTVTQFYTRFTGGSAGECFIGGCSSQVCSDRSDVITTCEWREEYACYQGATCERQADGGCGWTQTEDLEACLAGEQSPLVSVAECQGMGGRVAYDVGDGSTRCNADEREIGRVTGLDEGGRCCIAN